MVNVFLNNGHEFQEISIEGAGSVKTATENEAEPRGAAFLVCLDFQGHEVARFRWEVVAGYAIGYAH